MLAYKDVFLAIVDKRDRERFRKFKLGQILVQSPNLLHNSDPLPVWGFLASSTDAVWKKIKRGGLVLFSEQNTNFTHLGVIADKTIDSNLAEKIWGHYDPRSRSLDRLIFFQTLTEISLGFNETIRRSEIKGVIFPGIYEVVESSLPYFSKVLKKFISNEKSQKDKDHNQILLPIDYGEAPPRLREQIVRFIRDTSRSKLLKKKYNNLCQICNYRVEISEDVFYSEVHHIFPLKDGGADNFNNMIVLCPTHHAEFDYGVIAIAENGKTIIKRNGNPVGELFIQNDHSLAPNNIKFQLRRIRSK